MPGPSNLPTRPRSFESTLAPVLGCRSAPSRQPPRHRDWQRQPRAVREHGRGGPPRVVAGNATAVTPGPRPPRSCAPSLPASPRDSECARAAERRHRDVTDQRTSTWHLSSVKRMQQNRSLNRSFTTEPATVVADISERTRRIPVHRDDALPAGDSECMPGIAHASMRAHSAATGRHLCTHLPSDVPGLA